MVEELFTALTALWLPTTVLLLWGVVMPAHHHDSESDWSWRVDIGMSALCALLMAGACGWWVSRFYLFHGPYLVSDFHDYCLTLRMQSAGNIDQLTRSRGMWAAAIPSALVSRLGVVDSLAWGGVLGTGGIAAGLYLWGRAVHGRMAGVCAALSMAVIPELATFSRTLSFYPEITAGLALATGMTATALRFPRWSTFLLGGMGVGLALLIDLRGLVWGLGCGGLLVIHCFTGKTRLIIPRLAMLAAMVWGAWTLAPTAYQPQMDPLEVHIDLQKRLEDNQVPVPEGFPRPQSTYVWGQTPLLDIPQTLLQLQQQRELLPVALRDARGGAENRRRRVTPWRPVVLWMTLCVGIGLLRGSKRNLRAWILLTLSLPWLASLQGAIDVQRSFPRFLGAAYPVLALWLGVAMASLVTWSHTLSPRWSNAHHLRAFGGLLIAFLLVFGSIPSMLSIDAPWKSRLIASNIAFEEARDWMDGAPLPGRRQQQCLEALQQDEAEGHSWRGTLFGGVP